MNAVEYRPVLKALPPEARPRERLQHFGASALSDAELLAIILRTGTAGGSVLDLAQRLLARYGGLGGIHRASLVELCHERGLGPAKAVELKAAFELGRRLLSMAPEERPQVRSPADVYHLVRGDMAMFEQEHLRVLLLNTRYQVVGTVDVYKGSLNSAAVRVGELFRDAVRQNCAAIIIVHNHPSGDPTPSAEDVAVTRQAVEAGRLLNIDVLDHIIIGQQRYVSLKERGLGFGPT